MKRILVCLFIVILILSGCQSATGADQNNGVSMAGPYDTLPNGSAETKTPFLPVNDELFNTATLPGIPTSIFDTPIYTQNPSLTNVSTDENKQTPGIQASRQALTSTALFLSINNSVTPIKDTVIPPTSTPTGRYIVITGITDRRIGRASVVFEPHGDFISGFYLVWSETNTMPVDTFENRQYVNPSSNGFNQSTVFYGTPGKTYHFRVCEFIDHNCSGIYSNSYTFTLNSATATPTNTLTNNLIQLGVRPVGEGVAQVNWHTEKDYPNGFEIIWSSVVTMPDYPYNHSVHANNADRSIIVYGEPGVRYYYRICGYIGNVCDDYSASAEYIYNYKTPTFTPSPTNVRPTHIPCPPTKTRVTPTETETEISPTEIPIPTQINTEIPIVEETTEEPSGVPTEAPVETSEE